MELSDTIARQLEKFGYNVETLDELFLMLPEVVLTKIGKSIKRTPISFLIEKEGNKYSCLAVIKNGENEPDILQRTAGRNPLDVLGSMNIWLNKSGLLGDSIEE